MFRCPGWNRLETTPPVQHSLEVVIVVFFLWFPLFTRKRVSFVFTRKRVSNRLLAKECHFFKSQKSVKQVTRKRLSNRLLAKECHCFYSQKSVIFKVKAEPGFRYTNFSKLTEPDFRYTNFFYYCSPVLKVLYLKTDSHFRYTNIFIVPPVLKLSKLRQNQILDTQTFLLFPLL